MDCKMPGSSVLHYLLEFAKTHVHWASDAIQPFHPLLLLPTVFPSIRVFSSEWALHIRWLKYWNFSISPSNEYSGLISIRIDWFDLLAVQGTLKSLIQHHSSKASILWHSAFFMAQFSYRYTATKKMIALTIQMFVSKVTSFQFSCSVVSQSLWPPGLQHTSFSVHHQLPELAQTHVYLVGDAIQPSHPLWSSSPPAFSFLQHQGLFQWVSSSHQMAKVLELQHQSFQWKFRADFL